MNTIQSMTCTQNKKFNIKPERERKRNISNS